MSNVFDRYANTAFSKASNLMGFDATWEPLDEPGQIQRARVLFREPTTKEMLGSNPYYPTEHLMEYINPDFSSLKHCVDSGNAERVTVNGKLYTVLSVTKHYDGRTNRAKLEPIV